MRQTLNKRLSHTLENWINGRALTPGITVTSADLLVDLIFCKHHIVLNIIQMIQN